MRVRGPATPAIARADLGVAGTRLHRQTKESLHAALCDHRTHLRALRSKLETAIARANPTAPLHKLFKGFDQALGRLWWADRSPPKFDSNVKLSRRKGTRPCRRESTHHCRSPSHTLSTLSTLIC